jgi:hypothetical protein
MSDLIAEYDSNNDWHQLRYRPTGDENSYPVLNNKVKYFDFVITLICTGRYNNMQFESSIFKLHKKG